MPRLTTIRGLPVCLFYNDHPPPHLHIRGGETLGIIHILTGEINLERGKLARAASNDFAVWLSTNRGQLVEAWNLASVGQQIDWTDG